MRPRKWVLIAFFFCLIIIFALYHGKRHVEKKRDLENFVIQSISPFVKGTIDVRKIRIGFFSAHLHGITLSVPLESFKVQVDHIKIGFSFSKLINFDGDYSKAINKIIFIKPELFFIINQQKNLSKDNEKHNQDTTPLAISIPGQLPVPNLIIKNGCVRLLDRGRDTILVGEHLYGTLTGRENSTEIDLSGKSGSINDNLSLSGSIAWKSGNHSLSINLKRAAIKKPIAIKDVVISSGTISGSISFAFSDTLSLEKIFSSGNLAIEQAHVIVEQLPEPLDSVTLFIRADGSSWYVDTLSATYKKSLVKVNGICNLIDTPWVAFDFLCTGLNPDSINITLPENIRAMISGNGSITGKIQKEKSNSPVNVQFMGDGFNIGNFTNVTFSGACAFKDSGLVIIDSLRITDKNVEITTSGKMKLGDIPDYEFLIDGSADSLPFISGLDGFFKVTGTINEKNGNPFINLVINGRKINVMKCDIGNQMISIVGDSNKVKLKFLSSNDFSGIIDIKEPLSDNRVAELHLNIGSVPIKSFLKRNSGIPEIDSAQLALDASGCIDSFSAKFLGTLKSGDFQVCLNGALYKNKLDQDKILWQLNSRELKLNGKPIEFVANGRLYKDSLVVDSLNILNGITGNASVYFNTQPIMFQADCNYRFSIQQVLSMIPKMPEMQVSGNVYGRSRIYGAIDDPYVRSELHIRDLSGSGISNVQTDAIVTWSSGETKILPMVIRKDLQILATFDTITTGKDGFSFTGEFDDVDVKSVVGNFIPPDLKIDSRMSGTISTTGSGFPIDVNMKTPQFRINKWKFDAVNVNSRIDRKGISVKNLKAKDGTLLLSASGFLPWSMVDNSQVETDTLNARIEVHGDFLKYIGENIESPIAGTGQGSARIAFYSVPGMIKFTDGIIEIPEGVLSLRPFVLTDIKKFNFLMKIDSTAKVHTRIAGMVKKRSITIFSNHDIPNSFEPFLLGPLNLGILQVKTPDNGIDIHLPGFMPVGEIGDIEFQGKNPNKYFTLSGPVDKLKISGVWVLRDLEFTFPFLNNNEMPWDFDPFPYVNWDLDLKAGNRRVMYFWDLSGKKRRILRFLEGYLDPGSIVKVRGRDLDYTFSLYGSIRSYKGAVYYGRMFDRNFNVGVEFEPQKHKDSKGFDNLPIIWGSAEALSDSSRHNRTKIICMVQNPQNKAISERGRLVEGKKLNISFQVSSDFEEQPGEGEREFFRQAGLTFTTLGGAGELISDFGEQYFHRYLLQRWERRLAKIVGLDVINIESSITSNYFNKLYSRQFDGLIDHDDYLALANVGITVGRYFFRDYLFLKARGELIPIDTVLRPEYRIGMELQPSRYLVMDFNYGIHKGVTKIEHDPSVTMQLTLPIARIRKLFKF